ncbi:MAG: glutathione S-transferase family protein [Candidatus Binatia bacterium]
MSDATAVILHQYDMSPFSEKIRKILAFKNAPWRAVTQSMWLPRPQLTPMTGAYRRIPVMQIGADIWCDTRLIAQKLDALFPDPPLVPRGLEAAADSITQWADRHMFGATVPLVFTALGAMLPPELMADRKKMRPDLDPAALAALVPDLKNELRVFLAGLDRTLAHGGFLLGDTFSVADASVYHVLWFARNTPDAGAMLAQLPGVQRWLAAIDGMGQGKREEMTPEAALAVAKAAEPATPRRADDHDPNGLSPGTKVAISSDDLPQSRFEGEVIALDVDEVVILRHDEECGAIALHFPRAGYRIAAA